MIREEDTGCRDLSSTAETITAGSATSPVLPLPQVLCAVKLRVLKSIRGLFGDIRGVPCGVWDGDPACELLDDTSALTPTVPDTN